jgi:hypothetical protein
MVDSLLRGVLPPAAQVLRGDDEEPGDCRARQDGWTRSYAITGYSAEGYFAAEEASLTDMGFAIYGVLDKSMPVPQASEPVGEYQASRQKLARPIEAAITLFVDIPRLDPEVKSPSVNPSGSVDQQGRDLGAIVAQGRQVRRSSSMIRRPGFLLIAARVEAILPPACSESCTPLLGHCPSMPQEM